MLDLNWEIIPFEILDLEVYSLSRDILVISGLIAYFTHEELVVIFDCLAQIDRDLLTLIITLHSNPDEVGVSLLVLETISAG